MESQADKASNSHSMYMATRAHLFELKPESIGISSPPEGPDVWGVVIDFPTAAATATLVIIADGTVNLLLSREPSFIGAGQHKDIADAASALLADAKMLRSNVKATTDFSTPDSDRPRVYLLTSAGALSAELLDDQSSQTQQVLAGLVRQGDGVITSIRLRYQTQSRAFQQFTGKDNFLQAKIIAGSTFLGAVVGPIAAPEPLPGLLMGGFIGLALGFLASGILLMLINARRRRDAGLRNS